MDSVTYEAACPTCGETVTWSQTQGNAPTTIDHNHREFLT
jgi:endogenous inhibitor of DNA gyrase (YacG/DUF329 family)